MSDARDEGRIERAHHRRGVRKVWPVQRAMWATALAVAVTLGVLGGSMLGSLVRGPAAAPTATGTRYVFLTLGFDFATGRDRYFPANFTVPTHTLIVVTITSYDDASDPVAPPANLVSGTVGNAMVVQAGSQARDVVVGSLPAAQVAHTLTLEGGTYALNVPVPPANSRTDPAQVTFRAYFNVTGVFEWHCQAPCDAPAMTTSGFMQGTVTVVDA